MIAEDFQAKKKKKKKALVDLKESNQCYLGYRWSWPGPISVSKLVSLGPYIKSFNTRTNIQGFETRTGPDRTVRPEKP